MIRLLEVSADFITDTLLTLTQRGRQSILGAAATASWRRGGGGGLVFDSFGVLVGEANLFLLGTLPLVSHERIFSPQTFPDPHESSAQFSDSSSGGSVASTS